MKEKYVLPFVVCGILGLAAYAGMGSAYSWNPIKWFDSQERARREKIIQAQIDLRTEAQKKDEQRRAADKTGQELIRELPDKLRGEAAKLDGEPGYSFVDQARLANELGFSQILTQGGRVFYIRVNEFGDRLKMGCGRDEEDLSLKKATNWLDKATKPRI